MIEIQGKVTNILDLQSGEGKNGPWKKQDFILETESQYPKKVCITLWGDKIEQFNLNEGEEVKVFADIESREFKGRWYTDVKAWKIEKPGASSAPTDTGIPPPQEIPPEGPEDDLPF